MNINYSHKCHCIFTSHLHKNNPFKFGIFTPKLISFGIYGLFENIDGEEGVLSSTQIIHNCDRAYNYMRVVYENKGIMVKDLADGNSIQYGKEGRGKYGDVRIKAEIQTPPTVFQIILIMTYFNLMMERTTFL